MARETRETPEDQALREVIAALLDVHAATTPEELAGAAHRASQRIGGGTQGTLASGLAQHVSLVDARLRGSATSQSPIPAAGFARAVFDARKLQTELERELMRAERYRRQASIVVIEATNLRLLRERFGEQLVEQRLERMGETLARHARDIDVIGAYRDRGYTMILSEASNEGAANAADRLLAIGEDAQFEDASVPGLELHLAAGWATYPDDGVTTEALFAAASDRMYGLESKVA